jgi:hypothetical protein
VVADARQVAGGWNGSVPPHAAHGTFPLHLLQAMSDDYTLEGLEKPLETLRVNWAEEAPRFLGEGKTPRTLPPPATAGQQPAAAPAPQQPAATSDVDPVMESVRLGACVHCGWRDKDGNGNDFERNARMISHLLGHPDSPKVDEQPAQAQTMHLPPTVAQPAPRVAQPAPPVAPPQFGQPIMIEVCCLEHRADPKSVQGFACLSVQHALHVALGGR